MQEGRGEWFKKLFEPWCNARVRLGKTSDKNSLAQLEHRKMERQNEQYSMLRPRCQGVSSGQTGSPCI
eukprot:1161103-Pelagomonas_calceolata.AAC.2